MILHKKTILNNISKADCHENVLSSEDIEKVWQTAFLGGNVRKNSLGNVFISGDVVKRAYETIL